MASDQANTALRSWLLENAVQTLDPTHAIYTSPHQPPSAQPWRTNPRHFTRVYLSAIAVIKMVIHARRGGSLEVMGLMHGKVMGDALVVMDAFALPVEGTETRVNAQQEAYEYMVQFQDLSSRMGRKENIIGWYHSHPGYGCWLSGIDVATQTNNQTFMDPFLAVVVDPNRTISAGRVEIGAFRTYPEGYTPPDAVASEYQSIPLSKIEDFGVHANSYYALPTTIYKSKLDSHLLELLWNKHWISTLSQSPLITNKDYLVGQLADIAAKLARAETQTAKVRPMTAAVKAAARESSTTAGTSATSSHDSVTSPAAVIPTATASGKGAATTTTKAQQDETHLGTAARDAAKTVSEAAHALMAQVLKNVVFNGASASPAPYAHIGSPQPGSMASSSMMAAAFTAPASAVSTSESASGGAGSDAMDF
ncbi:JAB1/Mov34/MPN/PAD-1 ubiquitin protease-domain-containing protein [Blastocladiella britannica]|nr:JAB1/Mov34/MPN/PAD-1 ubiquitin protease-domain-containing protein [Blastocladiella britannica]